MSQNIFFKHLLGAYIIESIAYFEWCF